jgi:ribonuclease PH
MDFTDDAIDVPAPLEASVPSAGGHSLRSHALKGSEDALTSQAVPGGTRRAGIVGKTSRPDNLRGHHQIRAMWCEQGIIHRADGSARMAFGETVAIAAVYGPKLLKASRVDDTSAVAVSVSISSASHSAGTIVEREMEVILRDTVAAAIVATSCPRTEVSVIIQVVHDAGSLLQCITAAVCLALLNAGLPLKYMFAALTCGCPGEPSAVGDVWMDLTVAEESVRIAR